MTYANNVQGVLSYSTFDNTDLASIYASRSTSPGAVAHVNLVSCEEELLIANAGNAASVVDIYDISLKHDIGNGTFEAANVASPGLAFSTSLIAQGIAAGNAAVGTKPWAADYFTEFYSVKKVTRMILSAGAVHRHRQINEVNKYLDFARDAATSQVKNLTHWVMVVSSGTPVNDTDDSAIVGTAEGALNIVRTRTYKFTWIDDGAPEAVLDNDLGVVDTGELITEATATVAADTTT